MRSAPLRRKPKRPTNRELALAWYTEVTSAHSEYEGRCVMCGRSKREGRLEAHHPIRQQAVGRAYPHGALWSPETKSWVPARWEDEATRSREDLRWDPSNGIPLCPGCHEPHTNRHRRVPFEVLGDGPVYFAEVHRDRHGTNFEVELEREHPRGLEPLRRPARIAGCINKREVRHGRVR